MPQASNAQTSFLGGEWSPFAQGRFDDPEYKRGMNVCLNGYPIETGAWTRRQGTRFCATSRYGQYAWLLPFAFAATSPYNMEFTNINLRFFAGPSLVFTNDPQTVASISNANPAVVTTAAAHGWSSGQMVQFLFDNSQAYPGAAYLFLRQFVITVISSTTFSIADPITLAGVDGSLVSLSSNSAQAVRVQELTSPYTTVQLSNINRVQAEGTVVTMCPGVAPWALTTTTAPGTGVFAQFAYAAATFTDGPYLDPPTSGTLTVSGTSGSITVSGAPANTFASTDVGRFIRMMSQPNQWASGTAYTTGQLVTYNSAYYVALQNNTGNIPGTDTVNWGTAANAAGWAWGIITAYSSGTQVTVNLQTNLLTTNTIQTGFWRLGVYSATTGYPTCGVYHEGRLWLGGAVDNRFDASNSNQPFNMSPTAVDGTVADSNAISYSFNAQDTNPILWMEQDNNGIICGSKGGEWMIASTATGDPITPTNIQAHRRSIYRGANVQPARAGFSLLFVQAFGRKVIEYVADVFSGKFLGRNLNEKTKHLTVGNIEQIAYQQELSPTIWARTGMGALIGATYRRESSMTAQPPEYNGWHRHALGSSRVVESLTVGPSVTGTIDALALSTNMTTISDPYFNIRHIELLTDMFEEEDDIYASWFLDDAVTPSAAVENSTNTQVTFYGMPHLVGKTVQVFAAGLDLGDYTVAANGSVTVPINAAPGGQYESSLFTDTLLTQLMNSGENYGSLAVPTNQTVAVQNPVPANFNIQSYIGSITNVNSIIDDFEHNRVFSTLAGSGSSGGINVFNRSTGVQLVSATAGAIMATTANQPTSNTIPASQLTLGSDGFLYCSSDNGNSSVLRKINPANLAIVNSFGIGSGSFLQDNQHMARISESVSTRVFGKNYLIYTGLSVNCISVIDIDSMTYAGHLTTFIENVRGQLCMGENISNGTFSYAAIYSVACAAGNSSASAGIYRTVIEAIAAEYYLPSVGPNVPFADIMPNPGISTTRLNTIAPSAVDATWSHFQTFLGPAYDETDGNILFVATTADAVTHTCYAIKVNSKTGAIIWTLALPNSNEDIGVGFEQSIIKFSQMVVMNGGTTTLCIINTSSGTLVSSNTVPSITTYGSFNTSCDIDGSICSYGSWNGNTLIGANGTVTFGGAAFKIQSVPGFAGQLTQSQNGFIPAVIGYTYTSQGQVLRGINAAETGARNGPAFGKVRRNHRYALQLGNTVAGSSNNTIGLKVGTVLPGQLTSPALGNLRAALLATAGGTPYAQSALFTGVWTQPIEDPDSYDGMIAWQITRPVPATVAAVGGFLETKDW